MTDEEMEDILELVYAEALALPDDLRQESGSCAPVEHDLLRWAASKIRERVQFQLSHVAVSSQERES